MSSKVNVAIESGKIPQVDAWEQIAIDKFIGYFVDRLQVMYHDLDMQSKDSATRQSKGQLQYYKNGAAVLRWVQACNLQRRPCNEDN